MRVCFGFDVVNIVRKSIFGELSSHTVDYASSIKSLYAPTQLTLGFYVVQIGRGLWGPETFGV